MEISIIIPTFQAEELLPELLSRLRHQTFIPSEIIIIDSSSTDETASIARQSGCITRVIERKEFSHGKTRNLGVNLAKYDPVVFLTQDILPATAAFLENLSEPIRNGRAVAAYARQIPYRTANPIEVYSRKNNYPSTSQTRTKADIAKMGVKAFFFSDAASIVDKRSFWLVGGFSEEVIVNEDMHLCAKFLNQEFKIAYQSEAVVFHSHNYRLSQLFLRYFKIGIFFRQSSNLLKVGKLKNNGLLFFHDAVTYLWAEKEYIWIPRLFIETVIKLLAFQAGLRGPRLQRFLDDR